MKKTKTAMVLVVSIALLTVMTGTAMAAYTIDGDLDDWGVHPPGSWYASSPAKSAVENWGDGPNSDSISPGIEECDIEAMYVDEDVSGPYIYIAIITSMPPEGVDYACGSGSIHLISGDLALDFDNDGIYEYGVKLTDDSRTVPGDIGDVFSNPTWVKITTHCAQSQLAFSNIDSGTKTGHATIVYTNYADWSWDNGAANYVIEMKIPKSALGISTEGEVDLCATVSCTNDVITIKDFHYTEIPEFATIALPLAATIGLFIYFDNRRKREEE
ncbi:MAG: conserved hypothetical protein, membrane [Candidatus Syntrophoarchaeum caldarius]|uniref:PEF-CTERM protein sorting domain-containing protein n=1 Tax=Candidatus Syntropharchaeum caldarium TaxID=1838285 RepID=A0A1F2PB17_9EURY|nr:MAG: conserved hypothetical protein, membrane [Candidatus Syntrophoarchaeum caldarius]